MTKAQPIDLSIIDDKDIKKIQAKKERLDRVMDVIKENGLDKDEKFMEEMEDLIDALIKEK
ncbi:MAG: hypothetical protein ACD_80C00011G0018 [uncultured bacterium (gcode 4)]|uniref:Uncharacterized protein n=1 Tax=uncultured bacterium (gcode 4) TaxID=1234023 RepID=K1XKC0_9BACT|nr:MAG: hypothetical protein ACD_80C00011G0018 [uncultured bacterium (gcode 4)]HBB04810.1 hypothetical protein [Candidatus Gracilibacteria bacterium]